MKIAGAGSMARTIILPMRLYTAGIKVVGDMYCADEAAYLIDHEGRVHCFRYHGKIPRPGETGYVETCDPGPDDLDGSDDE